ncbi:hypothetical protein C8R43DRAFT_1118775 [Mycena crocata]|nr:hypothetical protein C8R43DRAFT_1118775 [Mycena crocata]
MHDLGETANRSIISSASRVEKLVAKSLSPELFELLGKTAGSTLQELSTRFPHFPAASIPASIFAHFTELRVCVLQCSATMFTPTSSPDGVLARLHTLQLTNCNGSIFNSFSVMRRVLPALHTVNIDDVDRAANRAAIVNFLHAHATSILHARLGSHAVLYNGDSVFDVCRNLIDVHFDVDLDLEYLICKAPHTSLTKITARGILGDPDRVEATMFPSLREIQCQGSRWPTTEREISKSKRVPIAETLLEKNIKLADSTGRHWVPRVKNTRGRR